MKLLKPAIALILTAALVIGVPALLLIVVGNPLPSDVPSLDEITSTLTQSGQRFTDALISVIAIFIWLIWAQLMAALAVEIAATAQHKQSRQLPVMPGLQHLAGRIVAAITITATLAAGPLSGLAGAATYDTSSPEPTQTVQPPSHLTTASAPSHIATNTEPATTITLTENSDLWGLAEQLYGDGSNWRNIIDHNTDRTTPGGQPITAELTTLPAGTTIALSGTADIEAAAQLGQLNQPDSQLQTTNEQPGPIDLNQAMRDVNFALDETNTTEVTTVVVEPGDTLWGITETALEADLGRTPATAETAHQLADVIDTNADSLRSGDPDVIYPGEHVVVWTPEADASPHSGGEAPSPVEAVGVPETTVIDLTTAIDAVETTFNPPTITTPAEVSPPVEAAAPRGPSTAVQAQQSAGVLDQPPSGLFFGQFPTGDTPPEPAGNADIRVGELPPVPTAASNEVGERSGDDRSNGWDPLVAAAATDEEAAGEPAAIPTIAVPGGVPVHPEVNSTVNPEDLVEPSGSRTVKSLNWSLLLATLPLLGGGIWAALRRRRRLMASQRPSRYAAAEMTPDERDITNVLAGSSALMRTAKLQALSAQIPGWVPMNAPSLIAVTIDDNTVAVLWDDARAPEPVGEPASVSVEGSTWLIGVDDLVDTTHSHQFHGLPAMVHLGQLQSGRDLFVNLEELGRANLSGAQRAIERFCGRVAMELALNPMFDLGTVILVGFGSQLAAVENIEYYPNSEDALQALKPRIPSLERALATDSALQLRAAGQLDSDISPIVILDISTNAPHPELVAAAEACVGGLCMLHAGDDATSWPFTFDEDTIHLGGALDVTMTNNEPANETVDQIVAIVAAEIEYQPADTIEGAISDALVAEVRENDVVDEDPGAEIVVLEPSPVQSVDTTEADPDEHDTDAEVSELVITKWADPEPLGSPTGVRVRILGPVEVEGAEFSRRAGRYVELIALMIALGGKITVGQISEYMYNGEGKPNAILQLLRRTRDALGEAADGQPRLSRETPTKQYELHDVSSDYQQILDVCHQIKEGNETLNRDQACELMDSAVQLINGPPYAAAGTAYNWIFTIGETSQAVLAADSLCRELAEVYLALGNYSRARWSIRQGLKACPACEELYEALIRATSEDGTRNDVVALWTEITAAYEAYELEVPHSLATAYGLAAGPQPQPTPSQLSLA